MALQGVEAAGELGPVGLEPLIEFAQGFDPEAVEPTLGVSADLDQTGIAQHLEMPGNAGLMHADSVDEFVHRTLTAPHSVEDPAAGGLGDHPEDIELAGHRPNIHLLIYMHKGMYGLAVLGPCVGHHCVQTYNQMVVDQVSGAVADRFFHALADGTRRDILALAVGGGYSVSALAERYPMSFAAVQKHVAVLEAAGLVTKERRGRERLVRTEIDAVRQARALLDGIEELWRARVDRIDDLLAAEKRSTTGGKR